MILLRELENVIKLLLGDICKGNLNISNVEVVEEVVEGDAEIIDNGENENEALGDSSTVPQEDDQEGEDDEDCSRDEMESAAVNEKGGAEGPSLSKEERKVKCNVCGKELSSVTASKRHVSTYHINAHQCEICDRFFSTAQLLQKHSFRHLGFTCEACGRKYSTIDSLRNHRNRKHKAGDITDSSTPVICAKCGKQYCCRDSL